MVSQTNSNTNRGKRRDRRGRNDEEKNPYIEKVVSVRRVSKVVKGGRNLSFAAFVVIGDEKGKVGFSSGKAAAVPDAVRKAVTTAKKELEKINLKGTTVPHEVIAKFGASKVMIRPAAQGTGIIAGGGVRAVMEAFDRRMSFSWANLISKGTPMGPICLKRLTSAKEVSTE